MKKCVPLRNSVTCAIDGGGVDKEEDRQTDDMRSQRAGITASCAVTREAGTWLGREARAGDLRQ